MKITIVLPPANLSGGIRVAAIYAERLQRRGHEVVAVSPQWPLPSPRDFLRSLVAGKIPDFRRERPSHFSPPNVPHTLLGHPKPVVESDVPDADVVVATLWETAEWIAGWSPAKGAKAYFIQHHEVHDYLPQERTRATYSLPFHKITISRWLVDLMKTEYGDPCVSWIPNSVDTQQFHAQPRQRQVTPTVGLLYASKPWKGCDVSLKAFELAAAKIPDLRLVAFGAEPPTPELPLPENSQFYQSPPQDRIREIYAQCDVWLCGSWAEGFHLPPLEAMACRCPVVSTRVGGPVDIIEEGVEGHLVATGDSEALADRLVAVLAGDEQQWRAMSDAAYARALSYTWDDATDLFEAALEKAIDRHRSGEI